MKTTGIILIIFSGTGLGLCKSMELSGRLKILERLAQLLLLLKGEIRCTGASLVISVRTSRIACVGHR